MTKAQVTALLIATTVKAQRFNSLLPALASVMPGSFAHHNRVGFTKSGLESLEYDVKKAYGVSSRDLKDANNAFAKAKKENIAATDILKTGTDVQNIGTDVTEKAKNDVFTLASDEVKREVKLRERYPFLNNPETPHIGKFYELVGINGTAYNQMVEARKELFTNLFPAEVEGEAPISEPMTDAEIFDVAIKAVENFELNIEGVAELDYYRDNNEILGKHEIFSDIMLEKQVAGYSDAKILKQYTNLKGYVNREVSAFKKSRSEDKMQAFADKVEKFEQEIRLIEKRLAIKPEEAFASKLADVGRAADVKNEEGTEDVD